MKISIITVCFNSEKTIEQAIQSVISQNYDDLEYIIVDGGSTDDTLSIIEKYKKYISVCISEPDDGIYDAMNKGLEKATGDVVAFLNSDDWYSLDVLRKVSAFFNANDVDIVSGKIYIYSNGKADKVLRSELNEESIFLENVCPQPALFVKREVYSKLGGFDTSYKIAADAKWIIDVYTSGVSILCVEDYFTYFREGGVSTTKKYEALKELYELVLNYVQAKHLIQLEEKVYGYYVPKLIAFKNEKYIENALIKRKEDIRKNFDYSKKYYIWGSGARGMRCLDIFEELELQIAGFIDNNKNPMKVKGYQVIKPSDMDKENCVCITPKGYEEEIICQLQTMGLEEEKYFTYSEMMKQIACLGEEVEQEKWT